MSLNSMDEYWVPEHVKDYLRKLEFVLPLDDMEPWIRSWDDWMGARGDFYDYRDKDGLGRVYEVHRRSIHPAMRVCKEWGSLLLNEEVKVVCEVQKATDWIGEYFSNTGFMAQALDTVVRAFGLGTGAWALWLDLDRKKVRIRHYDARMVIPLTWDEDGIVECAFVTRAFGPGCAMRTGTAARMLAVFAEMASGTAASAGPYKHCEGDRKCRFRAIGGGIRGLVCYAARADGYSAAESSDAVVCSSDAAPPATP